MVISKHTLYNFVKKNHITKSSFLCYCVVVSMISYFIFVTIFGKKGLIEYYSLINEKTKIENQKIDLIDKIYSKKEMIKSIEYESLDLDLVDEQSRKILGYIGKNEVVIYQNKDMNIDKIKK